MVSTGSEKGVPEDLRELVGKREEKRDSLQTRDPLQAKRRHAEALAEIEVRWGEFAGRAKGHNRTRSAPVGRYGT